MDWFESRARNAMKQLKGRFPSALIPKLDDRLLDVGALAVDVAPVDDAHPDWAYLTIYLEPTELDAVMGCLRKRLEKLPRAERQRLAREFVLRDEFRLTDVDESWQAHWSDGLEPVVLVPGLVLVPEGSTYEQKAGERLMVLEKSLVFGFGEHPTTRMVSVWLAHRCSNKRVLDVGCGSGVLAFVAAHHAARSVVGIDIDPLSVQAATRNASRNGWQSVCSFEETPIQELNRQFDVVVANVDALTLESLSAAVAQCMAPNAVLALTGVLEEQADDVCKAFVAYQVDLRVCERSDDWVLLTNDP